MDGQWADDVHHALHSWLTGERFGYYVDFGASEVLAQALTEVFVHDGGYSTFRGRDWGAPVPDDVDRRRFVVLALRLRLFGDEQRPEFQDLAAQIKLYRLNCLSHKTLCSYSCCT